MARTRTEFDKALYAELEAAQVDLQQMQRNLSPAESLQRPRYMVVAELRVARARLAIEQGSEAWNRVAPDLEALRTLAIDEINKARAVYAECEQAIPEVPPLNSFEPSAILAATEQTLARNAAIDAQANASMAARTRLAIIFHNITSAYALLSEGRYSAGLPRPCVVLDPRVGATVSTSGPATVPHDTASCDAFIESIERQRQPAPHLNLSHTEVQIHDLEKSLAGFDQRAADDAAIEAARKRKEDQLWVQSELSSGRSKAALAKEVRERTARRDAAQ